MRRALGGDKAGAEASLGWVRSSDSAGGARSAMVVNPSSREAHFQSRAEDSRLEMKGVAEAVLAGLSFILARHLHVPAL